MKISHNIAAAIGLAAVSAGLAAPSEPGPGDLDLARRLSNPNGDVMQTAVSEVVKAGAKKVPLLLSWTRKPPDGIDPYQLNIGLADAFGQLKTEAAVPFLVKVIGINRFYPADINPWIKVPLVVENTYPAATALIRIGPAGAQAAIRASDGPMTADERLLAIFVVARVGAVVPRAREFLSVARGEAFQERYWAEEGLKALEH